MTKVDLVADLGETFGAWRMGEDEAILDLLTSANVACGFHAGDPRTMDLTVRRCVERGVAIGAHPSFPDRSGSADARWTSLTTRSAPTSCTSSAR